MTTSTLDKLLAEAQDDQAEFQELLQAVVDKQAKAFAVSPTYEHYAAQLMELVAPLEAVLPSAAEYEEFAAPRDDRIQGPAWDAVKRLDTVAKQLHTMSPAYVIMTECRRCEAEERDVFPELSDQEYHDFLDASECMADWWERMPHKATLPLAKSVIVHTVLENDGLREQVFAVAEKAIRTLVEETAPLTTMWRNAR